MRKELHFKQVFLVEYPEYEECTELRTIVLRYTVQLYYVIGQEPLNIMCRAAKERER